MTARNYKVYATRGRDSIRLNYTETDSAANRWREHWAAILGRDWSVTWALVNVSTGWELYEYD